MVRRRRALALAALGASSVLSACGGLLGIEGLTVDPQDARAVVVVADGPSLDASDALVFEPALDATTIPTTTSIPRVFVTADSVSGNILGVSGADGGLEAADMICTQAAKMTLDGGTWRAWLSTGGVDAIARIAFPDGGFVRVDAKVVATTKEQLVSGNLTNAISVTQKGEFVASGSSPWVFTGTRANGTASTADCSNWTASGPTLASGTIGYLDAAGAMWTEATTKNCFNLTARLYCFEQK